VCLLTGLSSAAKPKVITFGRWLPVQWEVGTSGGKTVPLKVRALMVNNDVKEFTTGDAHQVTDRIFVVRRAYRVNDSLSDEPSSAPKWTWQPDGWLAVDRSSAHIAKLTLPNYDSLYSTASWYRDYVAYCGVSDDGEKLYAMVIQMGQKKPIVKKLLGESKDLGMPDSQCSAPVWQKQPMRVTFLPNGLEKISFEIKGRAAELDLNASSDDEQ
jgi:hypothetical protein